MKMKKSRILIPIALFSLLLNHCQDPSVRFDPLSDEIDDDINIVVPDVIEPEDSIDDPHQMGVDCSSSNRNASIELIEITEIPIDLPTNHDLSEDMPPVRSQGDQGSCVAWATTYYMKSYQEKIQHRYDYVSFEDVMSPAFVYNQIKSSDDCSAGSAVVNALELLKEQGVNNWKDFPYSDTQCSNLPNDEQLIEAAQNKIKSYFQVGIPESNTDENYTLTNLIKTLVYQNNPIIITLGFSDLIFENRDGELIATSFSQNPTGGCGHAVLIVGYDNEMNAFKIVNSWGTGWGNEGYAWVHYNFFLSENDSDFEKGLTGAYIAYDEDE